VQTTEDSGSKGIPGQDTPDSDREHRIPGVQDTIGSTVAPTSTSYGSTTSNELRDTCSEVERTISTNFVTDAFGAEKWVPRPYQVRGVDWLLRPEAALFLPPGLGKSSMGLMAILMLKKMV